MADLKEFFSGLDDRVNAVGGTRQATSTSIGQLLDLYFVHLIITILFIAGGSILYDWYPNYTTKPYSAIDDVFFAIGAMTLAINVIFVIGLLIAWITKRTAFLSREDSSIHWLHALSISTAVMVAAWGIFALAMTFGNVLSSTTAGQTEIAGYFMVLLSVVYSIYLVIRYIFGLAGSAQEISNPPGVQAPQTLDAASLLNQIRSSAPPASRPFFGGGTPASFGGLDLSGLQSSSLSTLPPTQGPSQSGCPPMGGYPVMMMPQMMMMGTAPQPCNPDPNAIHLT